MFPEEPQSRKESVAEVSQKDSVATSPQVKSPEVPSSRKESVVEDGSKAPSRKESIEVSKSPAKSGSVSPTPIAEEEVALPESASRKESLAIDTKADDSKASSQKQSLEASPAKSGATSPAPIASDDQAPSRKESLATDDKSPAKSGSISPAQIVEEKETSSPEVPGSRKESVETEQSLDITKSPSKSGTASPIVEEKDQKQGTPEAPLSRKETVATEEVNSKVGSRKQSLDVAKSPEKSTIASPSSIPEQKDQDDKPVSPTRKESLAIEETPSESKTGWSTNNRIVDGTLMFSFFLRFT